MITAARIMLVGFLWMGAVVSAEDYRNQTILCVFQQYSACYHDIGSLGANFSATYDETITQIKATCQSEDKVSDCISKIVTTCNSVSTKRSSANITSFIHQLCSDRSSEEQQRFINSSTCYNQHMDKRLQCVNTFSSGNETDAKSLCCSNKKTLDCLKNEMGKVCSANATTFQNHLMEMYRSHHTLLCAPYLDLCNGVEKVLSTFVILITTLVSFYAQRL